MNDVCDKCLEFPLGQNFDNDDVPWKPPGREYEFGIIGLHDEIKDFYDFIVPNVEEQLVRELVFSRVKSVVLNQWPDCQVPIVKMTDKQTDLRVDISFNMINSVRAAELIMYFMKEYPCLPYLVFLLKQFLLQRNLNEVWTGGLSSYALILMCISFLQHTIRPEISPDDVNLGILLVEFFELYGRHFNYMVTAIRVTGGGFYVRKEEIHQNMDPGIRPSMICIEDPLCPGNDVGRRSYCAVQIKQAFQYAYIALSSAVLPQYSFLHNKTDVSILRKIIRFSDKSLQCRQRIMAIARQPCFPVHLNSKLFTRSDYMGNKKIQLANVPICLLATCSNNVAHDAASHTDSVVTEDSVIVSTLPVTNVVRRKDEKIQQDNMEKPGEYSILADELASLSTINELDRQSSENSTQKFLSSDFEKTIQARKRRCVRKISLSRLHDCDRPKNEALTNLDKAVPTGQPRISSVFHPMTNGSSNMTQPTRKIFNSFAQFGAKQSNHLNFFRQPNGLVIQSQHFGPALSRSSIGQKRHAIVNRRFRS